MPKTSPKTPPKPSARPLQVLRFERAVQISESHCGPAVIQMLLANQGIIVSQEAIAEAGGATSLIELHGMRVDQMAQAVRQLAPQACLWYKRNATLEDLSALVNQHNFPVGVEWQGLFEDADDEDDEDEAAEDDEHEGDGEKEKGKKDPDYQDDSETEDEDYGHYSLVTFVDEEKHLLIIVDPYKDFVDQDRIFTFEEFEKRWWDFNEVTSQKTGRSRLVEDYHMLFIVAGAELEFPRELKMKRFEDKKK